MKYQVKLLANKNGKKLEEDINRFLEELPATDTPVEINYSSNPPLYSAMIIFKEQ